MKWGCLRLKRAANLWALLAVTVAAGLLWNTQAVSAGVRSGLDACAAVIIPSLFPFMILAALISSTSVGVTLSRAVSRITRKVIGLPENLGAVLLMSFIGGFPVGARMLSTMLSRREIHPETAEYALCFCVNAGPSFLVSAVGASMFRSISAGLWLLAAQLLSALTIAAWTCRRHFSKQSTSVPPVGSPIPQDTFVAAVQSASAGILGICAFVVAFAAITALLRAAGLLSLLSGFLSTVFPSLGQPFFSAALTGLLEVTGGCIQAAALGGRAGYTLCAFLVSFSSLSILFQVKSCFSDTCPLRFGPLFRSRLLHGSLTALLASLFYRMIPSAEVAAWVGSGLPAPQATPNMTVTAACLICMCTILVFFPSQRHKV